MAKKKGIRIRRAKLEDKKLAMKLWEEYLNDEKLAVGGHYFDA